MSADYEIAFNYMMDDEDRARAGKVVPDPSHDHPDAVARFGINSGACPDALTEGFYQMDTDKALQWAASYYKFHYFVEIGGYRIVCQDIVNKYFSLAVNSGTVQATKLVQRAVNRVLYNLPGEIGLEVDGNCGEQTIAGINKANPEDLMPMIRFYAIDFYKSVAFRLKWSDAQLHALIARVNR